MTAIREVNVPNTKKNELAKMRQIPMEACGMAMMHFINKFELNWGGM